MQHATLVEVGPRDGLQNEAKHVTTDQKLALIEYLVDCGAKRIEAGAFVNPKRVPQMANTADVLMGLVRLSDEVELSVLVPNIKGFDAMERALDRGGKRPMEVAVFVSASEGFSSANLNMTIKQSLAAVKPVAQRALAQGFRLRGYISCITECPYDGPTAPHAVAEVTDALVALGIHEVSLGDTLGHATSDGVSRVLEAVLSQHSPSLLAGHFHDTRRRALANIDVCLAAGLRVFDTSIAGLGGCPFAPGAAGNVATEAVHEHLSQRGFGTGLDRSKLNKTANFARSIVHE